MTGLNRAIADLPLPAGLAARPISSRGFPVPWFVTHRDPATGELDFRGVDPSRILEAHQRHVCWICGRRLGRYLAFPIGPMCAIGRISAEPPSHRECAEYAARACPFLVNPRARRNAVDMPEHHKAPGFLERNPGVVLVWMTTGYRIQGNGAGVLFALGKPTECTWWCQGRPATRAEVEAGVHAGLPDFVRQAAIDGLGQGEIERLIADAGLLFAAVGAEPELAR